MPRALLLLFVVILSLFAAGCASSGTDSADSWSSGLLLDPPELAAQLSQTGTPQPLMIHVGFPMLYRASHITGSVFAGPGAKPEGLQALRNLLANEPKDRQIVIYCGCCPWRECPNMRPATALLREMGFTNFKVLMIPTNLPKDWTAKGYPTTRPVPMNFAP
jgi:thiosulfate/3-mercaptopyruvate sulfurtransferase